MKEKTINLHGVTGCGPTAKEARAEATKKLEALTSHAFEPVIISHPNYETWALVFRSGVSSYSYRIFYPAATPPNPGRAYGCSIIETEEQAIIQARRHLAQQACSVNGDDKSGLEIILSSTNGIGDKVHEAREHLWWLAWQREYKRLEESGVPSGNDCHMLACDSTTKDELVADLKAKFNL